MKCSLCEKPAVARLTVEIEILDLARYPTEWLGLADAPESQAVCGRCLEKVMSKGIGLAIDLAGELPETDAENYDPAGPRRRPAAKTDAEKDERLGIMDAEPVELESVMGVSALGVDGDIYVDADGNTYTRTDRGWVLSEYGPAGPPKGALGAGRKRPDKLN